MKSLYDKNFKYTEDATILDSKTYRSLNELFQTFVDSGYSPREISHIMHGALLDLEMETMISMPEKKHV